jgi:ribosomal protein L23
MYDKLVHLTEYEDIVKAIAEYYGFSVKEIDQKYHIMELNFWNNPELTWKSLYERHKDEKFIYNTEMDAWKFAIHLALLNLF